MRYLCFLFVLLLSCTNSDSQTVYVCSGNSRSKFHVDRNCRALKNCGGKIMTSTMAAMKAQGHGACKICSSGVVVNGNAAQRRNANVSGGVLHTTVAQTKPFATQMLELPNTCKNRRGQVVKHTGYVTNYNTTWLIPNWVAYSLTKSEVSGTVRRPNRNFEPDPSVKGRSAEHSDYTNSGYARGHMAPAADMKWSVQAMNESFYLSNVCPQLPALNGGVWERLESRCRALADDGTVYICCGPIVSGKYKRIGRNGVAVPTKFFKVLCMMRNGRWQAIGFMMPNAACKGSMFDYAMPVDEVERVTGHDFFPSLPDYIENVVEASWKMKDWQ